jgi:hypothetical protein
MTVTAGRAYKYLKMHVGGGVQLALVCDAGLFPETAIFLGTKYKYFWDTFVGKINSLSENQYAACQFGYKS